MCHCSADFTCEAAASQHRVNTCTTAAIKHSISLAHQVQRLQLHITALLCNCVAQPRLQLSSLHRHHCSFMSCAQLQLTTHLTRSSEHDISQSALQCETHITASHTHTCNFRTRHTRTAASQRSIPYLQVQPAVKFITQLCEAAASSQHNRCPCACMQSLCGTSCCAAAAVLHYNTACCAQLQLHGAAPYTHRCSFTTQHLITTHDVRRPHGRSLIYILQAIFRCKAC